MAERRHAIEQVRRMPRACCDGRQCFVIRGSRVTKRDTMAPRQQPRDEIETTVQLRRKGHDADIGCSPLDFNQDAGSFEWCVLRPMFCPRDSVTGPRVQSGAGTAEAYRRLRALVFGVDEVAFQMGR